MKKALIAAAVFMSSQANANAALQYTVGAWGAAGIVTIQNKDLGYFKTEVVHLGAFDTQERCEAAVKIFSQSRDYVGTGGTDNHVDGVQWNYDATCYRMNSIGE